MIRSAPHRASGRAASLQAVARVLLIFTVLHGGPLLAQPFRIQTVPPGAPSPEARQSFRTKIGEQARLLASDPPLGRVPQHRRQALVEFVVGNVLFAATHEIGHALLAEMSLPTMSGAEAAADDFTILTVIEMGEKHFSDRILIEAAKGWFTRARRKKQQRACPITTTGTASTCGADTGSSA